MAGDSFWILVVLVAPKVSTSSLACRFSHSSSHLLIDAIMVTGRDLVELQSLRSSSSVSSRYPTATHDEDSRALENPVVDPSTDYDQPGKAMAGAPEIGHPAQRRAKSSFSARLPREQMDVADTRKTCQCHHPRDPHHRSGRLQQTSLSKWHSGVSINTLVNVLTTIASTALIYPVTSSIAQSRWLWLRLQARPLSGLESFGAGPVDVFLMVFKHPTM